MERKICTSCLGDELTDAEAMAIVKEELSKIDTLTLAKVVTSGDLTPINGAIKEAVKRICVKGAVKQANNVYIWVGGIVFVILLTWLIFK